MHASLRHMYASLRQLFQSWLARKDGSPPRRTPLFWVEETRAGLQRHGGSKTGLQTNVGIEALPCWLGVQGR